MHRLGVQIVEPSNTAVQLDGAGQLPSVVFVQDPSGLQHVPLVGSHDAIAAVNVRYAVDHRLSVDTIEITLPFTQI